MTQDNKFRKLYELPRGPYVVEAEDGLQFTFHHVDGMYSYCTKGGEVFHPRCDTLVKIIPPAEGIG